MVYTTNATIRNINYDLTFLVTNVLSTHLIISIHLPIGQMLGLQPNINKFDIVIQVIFELE